MILNPGNERYAKEISAQPAAFARDGTGADFGAPVPACPEWTLGELVGTGDA
ncbi:hypothetical protein AB0K15_06555 [Amycolatopsis sp. NPDC049253]|uniref:hypothetical protein n=1 Tax=Amycolatopsis sp. NPDC049253 TaxID=3155274 RepID=UPI0034433AD8